MASCISGRTSLSRRALNPLLSFDSVRLPVFLCPAVLRATHTFDYSQPCRTGRLLKQSGCATQVRKLHVEKNDSVENINGVVSTLDVIGRLPLQCPGCGAFSQTFEAGEAGFYTTTRRTVAEFIDSAVESNNISEEDSIVRQALEKLDPKAQSEFGLQSQDISSSKEIPPPVCDRCHKLIHHHEGKSIHHPTIQSIQDTLFETPHKYNHVYHIIDAADFPMSLVPNIQRLLHLAPQRTSNRRSKTGKFFHGRKMEVSFIITRSDLLAPLKVQVDHMMPYLTEVLRDALKLSGKDVRMGNVRCVSAKRNWWTSELKEEIWGRGGAGWMVGKVNVGKSQLLESVFPKGRSGTRKQISPIATRPITIPEIAQIPELDDPAEEANEAKIQAIEDAIDEPTDTEIDTDSMLPPAPREINYPAMPLVSSLPGTTASPIRLPFGNGKGELIDLPGLSRGDLELFVEPEHRSSLVMRSRVHPEQQTIKPGQSLLLGGFIRITPKTPDLIFLSYAFTPIKSHLTSTEKAIGIQIRTRETTVENIALPEVAEKTKLAGTFRLQWDVTKQRTGPLMDRAAANLKADVLPYRVMSADILIEGCGWVELVAQVRKRARQVEELMMFKPLVDEDLSGEVREKVPDGPEVEVFSPEGRFIGVRRPMGAWLLHDKRPGDTRPKGRPRQSMKGAKKLAKARARARPQGEA